MAYKPWRSQSVNLAFPSCARLFTPCSLRSIRLRLTSCVGAFDTLWLMTTGSVSRMIPLPSMVSDLLYEVSICREGSSRVDNLVNGERNQVVVLDYGPLVDRLLEKQVLIIGQYSIPLLAQRGLVGLTHQRIPQGEDDVVKQDLVLIYRSHDVHHNIGLHLVQDYSVVVEDDCGR